MVDASRVLDEFNAVHGNGEDSWYALSPERELPGPIAYFCAEYGIHESMQIYSGGLGVLAGDHCKSASDAALPFIGSASSTGVATSASRSTPMATRSTPSRTSTPASFRCGGARPAAAHRSKSRRDRRPLRPCRGMGGAGRPRADPPARHRRRRQRQGRPADHPHPLRTRTRDAALPGARARASAGCERCGRSGSSPAVWHLNEGHSAFLLIERARELLAVDPSLAAREALRRVGRDAVFTDPHPRASRERGIRARPRRARPAVVVHRRAHGARGAARARPRAHRRAERAVRHDRFRPPACRRRKRRLAAPRPDRHGDLAGRWPAIRSPASRTASTSRPGWAARSGGPSVAPCRCRSEVDLNGPEQLANLGDLDDSELWSAHEQQKREMVGFLEGRLARQLARHGESPTALREVRSVLNADALIIGFARRFATYKRADLLFRDEERLDRDPVLGRAPGADRDGRQGASGRPARAAGHPADLRAVALGPAARPGVRRSRTTTSGSRASSSAASTCGSTTPAARWRRRARRA